MIPKIAISVLIVVIASVATTKGVQGQTGGDFRTRHLVKDLPEQLHTFYSQDDDCDGSYEQILDNEFAQSRIKRNQEPLANKLNLSVRIRCLPLENRDSFVYDVSVQFGRVRFITNSETDLSSFYTEYYEPDYGSFGITPGGQQGKQALTDAVRTSVERALTVYLKANFDL